MGLGFKIGFGLLLDQVKRLRRTPTQNPIRRHLSRTIPGISESDCVPLDFGCQHRLGVWESLPWKAKGAVTDVWLVKGELKKGALIRRYLRYRDICISCPYEWRTPTEKGIPVIVFARCP